MTADHSHVFTIAGYPKRGNPILGKVVSVGKTSPELAADGMPYTTLGYTNGNGFRDLGDETDADEGYNLPIKTGRQDLLFVDTQSPGYHQEHWYRSALKPTRVKMSASMPKVPVHRWSAGTNEQNLNLPRDGLRGRLG